MKLTLPLPPSLNNLYANTARGRRKSAEGLAYAARAGWEARAQGAEYLGGVDVSLTLRFYMNRRGDLSNRIKALEDALTGIVWDNDRQVSVIVASRHAPEGSPRVEVEILPLSDTL